ncbi:unnamed protein product [Urochloa decumbens]|uniref:Uncharacterized protein n=1 Tax=Urochloa decumbens TaxID=240449 RepID=A0ABC9EJ14_9POAL
MDTTTTTQQARKAHGITASNVPKQLAFHLRIGKRGPFGGAHRGTTLLITNCYGVWSLRTHLYVKQTRFHRFYHLKKKAAAVEKLHVSLRKLGMRSWPEYDERIALLRGKLADAYWAAAPAPYRERAAAFLHAARQHRHGRRFYFCASMAMVAAYCIYVASWSAVVPARIMFLNMVVDVCLLYKPLVYIWRFTFYEPDVIVRMLERVS